LQNLQGAAYESDKYFVVEIGPTLVSQSQMLLNGCLWGLVIGPKINLARGGGARSLLLGSVDVGRTDCVFLQDDVLPEYVYLYLYLYLLAILQGND